MVRAWYVWLGSLLLLLSLLLVIMKPLGSPVEQFRVGIFVACGGG
jgi:hypothetical protein